MTMGPLQAESFFRSRKPATPMIKIAVATPAQSRFFRCGRSMARRRLATAIAGGRRAASLESIWAIRASKERDNFGFNVDGLGGG